MSEFGPFEVVKLLEPVNGFPKGARAVIVECHGEPPKTYDIEVFDESGRELGIAYGVAPSRLRPICNVVFLLPNVCLLNGDSNGIKICDVTFYSFRRDATVFLPPSGAIPEDIAPAWLSRVLGFYKTDLGKPIDAVTLTYGSQVGMMEFSSGSGRIFTAFELLTFAILHRMPEDSISALRPEIWMLPSDDKNGAVHLRGREGRFISPSVRNLLLPAPNLIQIGSILPNAFIDAIEGALERGGEMLRSRILNAICWHNDAVRAGMQGRMDLSVLFALMALEGLLGVVGHSQLHKKIEQALGSKLPSPFCEWLQIAYEARSRIAHGTHEPHDKILWYSKRGRFHVPHSQIALALMRLILIERLHQEGFLHDWDYQIARAFLRSEVETLLTPERKRLERLLELADAAESRALTDEQMKEVQQLLRLIGNYDASIVDDSAIIHSAHEALKVFEAYFKAHPELKHQLESLIQFARERLKELEAQVV